MSDQRADVIRKAERDWWALFHEGTVAIPDLLAFQADAVRAHLAAALDAEATQWMHHFGHPSPALTAIDHLRAALGVAPTDREGG